MSLKKPIVIVLITIIVVAGGFFLLLKGCLSKYDEHFSMTPVLYFEKDGKSVIFSIVQHQKATSYSQQGGYTRKSVSTNYYIQTNDAVTAEKLDEKKLKHQSDIKFHPVKIIGAAGNNAWLFIGELMAFDAFTLDKKADLKILEEKNQMLKDKFPQEERYYQFDSERRKIYFTAKDGTKWELNTSTMIAINSSADADESPLSQEVKRITDQEKKLNEEMESYYERLMRVPAKKYASKEISMQELQVSQKQYYEQQKRIRDEIDNLTKLKRSAEKKERDFETQDRAKKNIKQSSTSFYSLRGNQDTLAGNWYGLYSDQEFNKMKARVQFGAANDETARRILHIAPYVIDDNGESHIILENAMTGRKDEFLNGGFLLDKESAAPLRNSYPAGYLVVHKDIIGGEGKILVSRIDLSGKTRWTYNTTLKEWEDWICTKKSLIILGTDNKNLSSNQANLLLIINMETGKAAQYDYFNDKLRK